ncbi:MAG: hypothetical protein WA047_03180 [Phenylobacterium sp.]|uniref:hypothetical protein n=1 Tax=Phenylobacterium sp. TaxID=1871053 RepID=UPI003BB60981
MADRLDAIVIGAGPAGQAAVRRSLVRICPICDGFEVTGQAVAVIGDGALHNRLWAAE